MELNTRWIKIFKDIWDHKTRSLLVILSIAVGVAAVGMINNAKSMIERDLFGPYLAGNPALVQIYISRFDDNLTNAVAGMREVETVQARRSTAATIFQPNGVARDINLVTMPDFADIKINHLPVEAGTGIPGVREILLERQSAAGMGVKVGDKVTLEIDNQRRYELTVVGILHDIYIRPFSLGKQAAGYVSMSTLEWMGLKSYYNRLDLVTTANKYDRAHVLAVAALARDRVIQPAGYTVSRIQIPGYSSDPGQHWAQNQINGLLLVLQVMGILAIFLSGGLVVNTIAAILSQQIKQIGIMRSIGAVRRQLIGMYLLNVTILSVIGLLIGLPFGLLGAAGLATLAASFLNFSITQFDLPSHVAILQAAVGLIMPIGVALYPIISGTRISVYDAIYEYGLSAEDRKGLIDRLLVRIRQLSPPVMLSLRNTFRNKARLAFTVVTLTLAGAMFIAAFSTRASLTAQINEVGRYVAFDAALGVPYGTSRFAVEREARRIPGVTVAEGWASSSGIVMHADGTEGDEIDIEGVPIDIKTIEPNLQNGRWLQNGDTRQVVINDDYLEREPQIKVGSEITLKVGTIERTLEVVGILSKHLSGARVYMNFDTFARLTGRQNQADSIRVRADAAQTSSAAVQDSLAAQLEQRFKDAGLSTSSSQTRHTSYEMFTSAFDIILLVLIVMAGLLAVVGGLSLTGTMGMNVLERTREIGVLRAVGAANSAVRQVVVVEGVVVGLMSWIMSAIVSAPVSRLLAGAVVQSVLKASVNFQYSMPGLLIWLAIIIGIGIVSSLGPARNAVRLSVREVLDYE
ncbi:MAG TPA: FtsX-like permease family protein [Anaerolineae bacterium]|nr:FtsX-like permease family protein [Anaerolineae bacterium]